MRTALALAAGAGILLAAACASDTGPVPTTAAPAVPAADGSGAGLYAANCARCHGVDLRGTNQGPPFLDRIYEPGHHSDVSFLLAVRQGARTHHWNFGDMPPVEGLTDAEVSAIVAFVRERQRAAGIE